MTTAAFLQDGVLFRLTWTVSPAEAVEVRRTAPTAVYLAEVQSGTTEFIDRITGLEDGDTVSWTITGVDSSEVTTISGTAQDPTEYDYSFGEVDGSASTIRYTTLADVKARLGITHTDKDDRITQAIIATEIQIDQHLGRSFPDLSANPEYESTPVPITEAATAIAVAVYQAGNSPTGVIGSDDWIGTIDVGQAVRSEFRTNAMLVGYRATWGVA